MKRRSAFARAILILAVFSCGVLLQKYVGLGRLLPRPDRAAPNRESAALRYDAPVPPEALAGFGEPSSPFSPESAYVYSTGPERNGTGPSRFPSYRYYGHYRDVADYLASQERKAEARRLHDVFWAAEPAQGEGDPFATQRSFLKETLGVADAAPAGAVLGRERVSENESMIVSRLEMQSRIPAISFPLYTAAPAREAPRGVVIALHGHSGAPEKVVGLEGRDYTRAFGAELARDGYMVFAPYVLGVSRLNTNIHGLGMLYSKNTKYSIDLQKLLAVVDHVRSDPELGALPLAVYGISYGGRLAVLLAAIDARIDAVVSSGAMKFSRAMLEEHYGLESEVYWADQSIFNHPYHVYFDFADLARLVRPRPLVIEMGAYDLFGRPEAMVEEWRAVQKIYAEGEAGDRVGLVWFRGYHETSPSLVLPVLDHFLFEARAD
ncbi:MAG: dienelactone hydrolase family protein [Candidatus Eisenbacteria bacterium]|nr:dienelactone hydrolase family protein [Candidatus Eisenbacteria bacterium]